MKRDIDRSNIYLASRSWWRKHWWPDVIRQLDRERADWKRWCGDAEKRCIELVDTITDLGGADE